MKTEYIESEIITEKVANVKYTTNIAYSSIFNKIALMFNEILLNNPSPVILFSVINNVYGQAVFQFDIINSDYELNNEKYDDMALSVIRELSRVNTKDVFNKNNLIDKIPSLLNYIPKKAQHTKVI